MKRDEKRSAYPWIYLNLTDAGRSMLAKASPGREMSEINDEKLERNTGRSA